MKRFYAAFVCLFLGAISVFGQSDCSNANFEAGTLSGWVPYWGQIFSSGVIDVGTQGEIPGRHTITNVGEFDDIVGAACTTSAPLPTVPPNGGQHALKLGNEMVGAQAERVTLQIDVTPDLTAFVLNYAVVLNDPEHEDYQQPRFEMRIFGEDGELFECGEYSVTAGPDIPNFESCNGDWRVRPWTTAAFELSSYLGQTITIEILVTDCAQGGHAGYAYLDAQCIPLDFTIENYCPSDGVAILQIPDVFESYLWSTGDTTAAIEIVNPVPGDLISVEIMSATGCRVTLTDVIPPLDIAPVPQFDPITDIGLCVGDTLRLAPAGINLLNVYSPQLPNQLDSFIIVDPGSYQFISWDSIDCQSDTVSFDLEFTTPMITGADVTNVPCYGGTGGTIFLQTIGEIATIDWSSGASGIIVNNLSVGNYSVTVTDQNGCTASQDFTISQPDSIVTNLNVPLTSCLSQDSVLVSVSPIGGVPPYTISWSAGLSGPFELSLPVGAHSVTVTDNNGCDIVSVFDVTPFEQPGLELVIEGLSCFGQSDGSIAILIDGLTPPIDVLWSNDSTTANLSGLPAGEYSVVVTDAAGCVVEGYGEITTPENIGANFNILPISCFNGNNGEVTVSPIGGTAPYIYLWNTGNTTQTVDSLLADIYYVTVTDANGCQFVDSVELPEPAPLDLVAAIMRVSCYGANDGAATLSAIGGTGPYQYYWEDFHSYASTRTSLPVGDYLIIVYDANGCAFDTTITVPGPSRLEIIKLGATFPNCETDSPASITVGALGGNGPYQFAWQDGTVGNTYSNFIPGNYPVSVVDANGCVASNTFEIEDFRINLELNGDIDGIDEVCLGDSVRLVVSANNEVTSYFWTSTEPLSSYNGPSTSSLPANTMYYGVEVTDVYNCVERIEGRVFVNQRCSVFIPNVFSPNDDGVNDWFYVQGQPGLRVKSMQIFDRWGGQVFVSTPGSQLNVETLGWDGYYRGSLANPGVFVYLIEIAVEGSDRTITFKGDVTVVR